MRSISKVFVAGLIAVTTASLASAQEKVILDTDFNTLGDDGQVLIMLSQLYGAGKINLLGVTTVSGNQWVDQETADALRAVERLGIQGRVKVYQGAPYPLLHDYTYFNEVEKKIYGFGYAGAFSKPRPTSPDQLKAPIDGFAKTTKVADQNAVDFIVETVKKNPKEVTFLAIGPLTNLALAFRKNPEIVPLVKRIVYMGGAVDVPGNTNPAAEFNWWFDPEAAKIVLSQPIEQTVVGLEVAEKVMFTKAIYDRVVAVDTPITTLSSLQTANHFRVRVFEQEPDGTIGKLVALKDLNLKDDSKELRIRIQNPKLWYPKDSFHPEWRQNLYHLTYELLDEKSLLIDQVQSYTGLRTIKQNNGQLFINDELVHLRGVLNQLYRGDTLFTGNEETIKKEIRDTLALGFNFARFHQSVDKRAMEAADRMGLLFSAEAPSPEDITEQSVEQALQEVRELVILARNHPGLVQIDDINESWGLSLDPRQGQLKELMKTDPIAAKKLFDFGLNYMKRSTSLIFSLIKSGDSRFPSNQLSPEGNSHGVIVPSNDGWDESGSSGNADGGHFYAHDGQGIIENYKNLPQHISPGSSLPNPDASGNPVNQLKHQFVPGASSRGEPFYLSEMGGVGFVEGRIPPNTWGYGGIEKTKRAFALRIHSLFAGLSHIKVAGFTYTQLKDCGYEVNGLLTQFGLPILPKKLIREIVLMGYYPNRDKRIAKVYDDINRYFDEQVKLRFLNANVCKDLFL